MSDAFQPGLELQHEIEQWYYREARLLDGREYQKWLALCAPEIRYIVPGRGNPLVDNAERGTEAMAIVAELEAEIERLRSEAAASQGMDAAAIRAPLEGRIEELETELEHARTQVAGQASVEEAVSQATAPFQARIAELEATLEAARGAEGIDAEALAEAVAEARIPLEDRIRELEAAASQGDPAAIDAAAIS